MGILEEMFDDERQNLNERPYSRTASAIDSAKGKVKGMFGSGQVEQGAQETGEYANRLWADFKRYVGRKYGTHPKSVTYQDVAAFFKGNGLDMSVLGNNQNRGFSTKDVGQALLKAAQIAGDDFRAEPENEKPKQQPQPTPEPAGEPEQAAPQPAPESGFKGQLAALSDEDRAKLLRMLK